MSILIIRVSILTEPPGCLLKALYEYSIQYSVAPSLYCKLADKAHLRQINSMFRERTQSLAPIEASSPSQTSIRLKVTQVECSVSSSSRCTSTPGGTGGTGGCCCAGDIDDATTDCPSPAPGLAGWLACPSPPARPAERLNSLPALYSYSYRTTTHTCGPHTLLHISPSIRTKSMQGI